MYASIIWSFLDRVFLFTYDIDTNKVTNVGFQGPIKVWFTWIDVIPCTLLESQIVKISITHQNRTFLRKSEKHYPTWMLKSKIKPINIWWIFKKRMNIFHRHLFAGIVMILSKIIKTLISCKETFFLTLAKIEDPALLSTKSNACDCCEVSIRMLKYCSPLLDPFITNIVNVWLDLGYFPESGKCR